MIGIRVSAGESDWSDDLVVAIVDLSAGDRRLDGKSRPCARVDFLLLCYGSGSS